MNRIAFVAALLLAPAAALADAPGNTAPGGPAPADTVTSEPMSPKLGIGYKLGDGIGFFGGDVIVHPIPHLTVDLYGTYFTLAASNGDSGTGYAVAPAIQGNLREGNRSTPYAAIGMQYVHMTLGSAVGSGNGVFANIGYEWKWHNGFGIQLGGGVQYISKVEATNGATMLSFGGVAAPNLELGLRYMFL